MVYLIWAAVTILIVGLFLLYKSTERQEIEEEENDKLYKRLFEKYQITDNIVATEFSFFPNLASRLVWVTIEKENGETEEVQFDTTTEKFIYDEELNKNTEQIEEMAVEIDDRVRGVWAQEAENIMHGIPPHIQIIDISEESEENRRARFIKE